MDDRKSSAARRKHPVILVCAALILLGGVTVVLWRSMWSPMPDTKALPKNGNASTSKGDGGDSRGQEAPVGASVVLPYGASPETPQIQLDFQRRGRDGQVTARAVARIEILSSDPSWGCIYNVGGKAALRIAVGEEQQLRQLKVGRRYGFRGHKCSFVVPDVSKGKVKRIPILLDDAAGVSGGHSGDAVAVEKLQLSGSVVVRKGKEHGLPESLQVWRRIEGEAAARSAYGYVGRLKPDKKGGFTASLSAPEDAQLVIIADNGEALSTSKPAFFVGRAEVPAGKYAGVKVLLEAVPIRLLSILIRDDKGKPLNNLKVSFSADFPLWERGRPVARDISIWEESFTVSTDPKGLAKLPVIRHRKGKYFLRVDALDSGGNALSSAKTFAGTDALKAKAPMVWTIRREILSIQVVTKWEEAYSKEPFRSFIYKRSGPEIEIKGVPYSSEYITNMGPMRWFDLKPGKYQLRFRTKIFRANFKITGGTEHVTVPAAGKLPVKHTLMIMPKDPKSFKLPGVRPKTEPNRKSGPADR